MSRWGRRSFLKGLGLGAGAALFTPLLSRIAAAQTRPPRRFVFVVEGNCYEPITVLTDQARAALDATMSNPLGTARWWYRSYRHDTPIITTEADLGTAPALGPIAAHPEVAEQTAVLFGLSSKIVGGGHSGMHGVLASAKTIAGVAGGKTIDTLLGEAPEVRAGAPFDVIRLGAMGATSEPLDFGTCAFGRGRSAPLIISPTEGYNALFGSVGSPAGMAAFARRKGLLDFARDDVNAALAAFPGSSSERAKLESYLQSIEELSRRQQRLESLSGPLSANLPEDPATNPLYATPDPLDKLRAQLQLVAGAFKGGLANVAVIGCGTGGRFGVGYPSVSPDVGRHDLHHGSGGNAEFRRRIHEVTRLQVEAIANTASALAATPEIGADGSMLDHTVFVYIGDNGEQHHSTASEFPVVLIGGRGLGLKTGGRTIAYPGLSANGHRQVSNVWNTLTYLSGAPVDDFGAEGPTRRALGPLNELLA